MRGGVRGRARLTSTGLPTTLRVDRTRRMGVQQSATPTTIAMTTTIDSRRPNRFPPEVDFTFRGRPGQSKWVEPVSGEAPRSSTWDLTTSEDRVGRGVIPGRWIRDRSVGRA